MALPGDVTTITVTGTYLDMEGNPQHGTVTFAPSTGPFADSVSPAFFEPVPVVAKLYFGQISQELPCTSNADFAPDTWAWQVTEQIEGSGERTYYVELPSTLGSTVDLSDLAQVEPTSSFTGYLPLAAGSASPVGGTVYLDGSPPLKLPSGTSGDVLMSDGSGNLTLQPVGDADWYNVKDPAYGALGNGSDATAAINAAITACHTAGGGTVYIPEGLYTISAPLLIGGGNPGALVIRGSGWNSELKLASGANCYIFDTGSSGSPQYTNGLVIADLYLDCNGANQTADSGAIYGRGSVWGVFEHLWIDQPYNYGVRFYQDGLGHYGHHNRLFGCKFTNGNGGGVYTPPSGALGIALYFDNADENSCHGCTFQDNGTSTYPATQVYDTGSGRQSFSGCTWVTTQTTSASMFKTNSSPSGCQITGCQFDSATTGNLLEINGPDCVIVGNEFLSFGQGSGSNAAIHLSSTYTQVTSNGFTPAGSNGIAVQETGTALTGVGYNVISGCSLSGSYYESAPVVLVSGDDSVYVTYPLPLSIGGTGASSASAARTNLGLGSAATQSSSAFDAAGAAAAAQSAAEAASLPLSGGQLTGGLTVTSLQVTGGTLSSGDVLTSDSSGNATWQAASAGPTGPTGATGPTGPAGPAGLVWYGTYSNTTTYAVNDAVYYNGSAFIATAGTTGVNPGTPSSPGTNWNALASEGGTGPAGTGVAGIVFPTNQGFLGWSVDQTAATSSGQQVSGQIWGTKVTCGAATTTGIACYVATAGVTLTAGENYLGLIDSTGTLQAYTADCSGATYTVTTTASSATVTGTGFIAQMAGGQYTIAGVSGTFTVSAVNSSTSLTMTATVPTAVSGATMTPTANFSWLSTGEKFTPWVTAYSAPNAAYYAAILSAGSTVTKFQSGPSGLPTALIGACSPLATGMNAVPRSIQVGGLTGQTAIPGTVTLSASSQINTTFWLALY